jgi:hypothetical protein
METAMPTGPDYLRPSRDFYGDCLFRVRCKHQGESHASANLWIEYKVPKIESSKLWHYDAHSGPGIYGCFWDEGLFYVGTYAGNADPFNGSVAKERWRKHIAGMTFRGFNVSVPNRAFAKISRDHSNRPLAQLLINSTFADLCKDRGLTTTYCKFLFADRHWDSFQALDDDMLRRFRFVYLQPDFDCLNLEPFTKESIDRRYLRPMERLIIQTLRPPCNAASRNATGVPEVVFDRAVAEMRRLMNAYI